MPAMVLATAVACGSIAVATAARGPNLECGTVTARPWKIGGHSGHGWTVTAAAATGCKYALKYAPALTHLASDVTGRIEPAPTGYLCAGTPINGLPLKIACTPTTGRGGFDVTAIGYRT
jgi:hypothetical protein